MRKGNILAEWSEAGSSFSSGRTASVVLILKIILIQTESRALLQDIRETHSAVAGDFG